MDEPRVIKRYANRKLYDTVLRRFTTLDELAALVEGGVPVEVREHDSGLDRTSDVLAQMVGRRLKSGTADQGAVTGLLTTPVQAASGLTSLLLGGGASTSSERPAGKQAAKSGKKSHSKAEPKSAKKSEKKASKQAPKQAPKQAELGSGAGGASDAGRDADRDAEVRELRQQVSELTAVVNLLIREKYAADE